MSISWVHRADHGNGLTYVMSCVCVSVFLNVCNIAVWWNLVTGFRVTVTTQDRYNSATLAGAELAAVRSVSVSCHVSEFCHSGWTDRAGIWHRCFSRTYIFALCCKEIRLPPKQGYFCLQVCFKLWTLEISQQHSFTPGLKLSFSANPSHHSLPFLLLDWLHGFPGLFTDTSEHIRFFLSALPVLHC